MEDVKVMFRWLFGVSFFVNIAANAEWVPHGSRNYFFGTRLVNYTQAESLCTNILGIKSQLVHIYTEEIQNFLKEVINSNLPGKVISYLINE